RHRLRDVLRAIHAVPQLVEHGPGPVLVWDDVPEHADVPVAIDVRAERVRGLPRLLVQIAPGDHVVDRQADALVEGAAELEDVRLRVRLVPGWGQKRRGAPAKT